MTAVRAIIGTLRPTSSRAVSNAKSSHTARPDDFVEVSEGTACPTALPWYSVCMTLAHSKVTAQGQISVPAAVRRKLGIGPGAVLEWEEKGGQVVVRRAGRFSSEDVHGALFPGRPPKRRTVEEMKQGVRRHIKERYARG